MQRSCQALLLSVTAHGLKVIERAEEILGDRSVQLSRKIILIEERLADPDNLDRQSAIERLQPCCQEGDELVSTLKRLTRA
jgi:hypothetical protein